MITAGQHQASRRKYIVKKKLNSQAVPTVTSRNIAFIHRGAIAIKVPVVRENPGLHQTFESIISLEKHLRLSYHQSTIPLNFPMGDQ